MVKLFKAFMPAVKRQVLVVAVITVIIRLKEPSLAGVFSQVVKRALRRDRFLDFSILFAELRPIPSHAIIALAAIVLAAIVLGDIKAHEKTMKSLYFLALIITGGFTLLPGRVMHTVLFGA